MAVAIRDGTKVWQRRDRKAQFAAWGIYLLRDHRLDWGVPMLLLAAACLAALFTPASLRALNRPPVRP